MADDFPGEVKCRVCKKTFSEVERVCPYCGADYRTNWDCPGYRAVYGCASALAGLGVAALWLYDSGWLWTTSTRELAIGLAVVAAVALGYWFIGYWRRDHWADD